MENISLCRLQNELQLGEYSFDGCTGSLHESNETNGLCKIIKLALVQNPPLPNTPCKFSTVRLPITLLVISMSAIVFICTWQSIPVKQVISCKGLVQCNLLFHLPKKISIKLSKLKVSKLVDQKFNLLSSQFFCLPRVEERCGAVCVHHVSVRPINVDKLLLEVVQAWFGCTYRTCPFGWRATPMIQNEGDTMNDDQPANEQNEQQPTRATTIPLRESLDIPRLGS